VFFETHIATNTFFYYSYIDSFGFTYSGFVINYCITQMQWSKNEIISTISFLKLAS